MKKFEYDIIEIPNSAVNGIKDFLNDLGAKGWEITHYSALSGSIAARLLVKRELVEADGRPMTLEEMRAANEAQLPPGPLIPSLDNPSFSGDHSPSLGREL